MRLYSTGWCRDKHNRTHTNTAALILGFLQEPCVGKGYVVLIPLEAADTWIVLKDYHP
jgi:hypothetical protein